MLHGLKNYERPHILKFYKKKSLGQNFLRDQVILDRLVGFIAPQLTDNIAEIGPGDGALTKLLLPYVNKLNVIELDQEVIPHLNNNCNNSEKLHVFLGDILKFDLAQFSNNLRLVGNLPYNISTPILFKTIKHMPLIQDMHFMLQKEVAERITAAPGSKIYGRLSIMLQYYFQTSILIYIGAESFSPPPKVDSAFIRLRPHVLRPYTATNELLLGEIVTAAFCQRRKTISNSLKKYITPKQLEELNINPAIRPEQLSVENFVTISNKLGNL